jgi:hypothetical protein
MFQAFRLERCRPIGSKRVACISDCFPSWRSTCFLSDSSIKMFVANVDEAATATSLSLSICVFGFYFLLVCFWIGLFSMEPGI